eukprot:scaffold119166_cov40-Phaeocystis_antarctica.AAC.1
MTCQSGACRCTRRARYRQSVSSLGKIGGRRPGAGDIVLRLVEGQHGRLRLPPSQRRAARHPAPRAVARGPRLTQRGAAARHRVPLSGAAARHPAPLRGTPAPCAILKT